ncbi:MAG: hypothetical protein AVDCRST_MAG16-2211, partial [uncultured Frankineae bacterium]
AEDDAIRPAEAGRAPVDPAAVAGQGPAHLRQDLRLRRRDLRRRRAGCPYGLLRRQALLREGRRPLGAQAGEGPQRRPGRRRSGHAGRDRRRCGRPRQQEAPVRARSAARGPRPVVDEQGRAGRGDRQGQPPRHGSGPAEL